MSFVVISMDLLNYIVAPGMCFVFISIVAETYTYMFNRSNLSDPSLIRDNTGLSWIRYHLSSLKQDSEIDLLTYINRISPVLLQLPKLGLSCQLQANVHIAAFA